MILILADDRIADLAKKYELLFILAYKTCVFVYKTEPLKVVVVR